MGIDLTMYFYILVIICIKEQGQNCLCVKPLAIRKQCCPTETETTIMIEKRKNKLLQSIHCAVNPKILTGQIQMAPSCGCEMNWQA